MFKSQCIGCLSLPREHPEYGRIWGSPTGKKAHQPQALLFPLTSMCFILSSLQLLSSFSLGQHWEEVGRERVRARERASEHQEQQVLVTRQPLGDVPQLIVAFSLVPPSCSPLQLASFLAAQSLVLGEVELEVSSSTVQAPLLSLHFLVLHPQDQSCAH